MNFQGVGRRTAYGVRRIFLLSPPVAVLLTILLGGCVHVGGTAGYWKIGADGKATAKKASFDAADYIPGSTAPGKITV